MIPKFRFFGKVADGAMRMVLAEAIDFTNGFVYYSYHEYTVEGDDNVYGDVIGFEDCVLMQSTGLFDKNGKEIYEGDILEVRDTSRFGGLYRGAVKYFDNWGVYGFNLLDAKVLSTNEFKKHSVGFLMKEFGNCFTLAEASSKRNYSYEVIGNIYENPELLEEE